MTASDLRSAMIRQLKTIASPEQQRVYQRNVPVANVAAELVCQWFDDFHPDSVLFRQAFTAKEIETLSTFTATFNEHVDSLPDELEEMINSPAWCLVMNAASIALKAINWEDNGG